MKIKGIKNMNELSTHKFTGLVLASLLVMCLFGCGESGTESVDVVEIPTIGQSSEAPKSSSSQKPGNVCFTISGELVECDKNDPLDLSYRSSSSQSVCSSLLKQGANKICDPRDEKIYETVTIGDQIWLAENMRYWNPLDNMHTYVFEKSMGYYYLKSAAEIACPSGWHLPSEEEWRYLLETYSSPSYEDGDIYYGYVGRDLKATTTWQGRDHGDNELGFNALASGIVANDFLLSDGLLAEFWTSTEAGSPYTSKVVQIVGNDHYARVTSEYNEIGASVRCVYGKPVVLSSSSASIESSSSSLEGFSSGTMLLDERDGQIYKIRLVDSVYWMTENLNYEAEGSICASISATDSDCEKYGRMYTWEMAENACPEGWRIPETTEFEEVVDVTSIAYDIHETFTPSSYINKDTVLYEDFLGEYAFYWTSKSVNSYAETVQYVFRYNVESGWNNTLLTLSRTYYTAVRCVRDAE